MKKVYTAFQFGNYASGTDDVLNVTLENDMYNENIRGSRSIIEDKVQGVEAPYFFYIDDEPLEFEVNFAFEGKTKSDIKAMMRKLVAAKIYNQLKFGEYDGENFIQQSPTYNVIFVGEPVMSFIGRNVENELKYDGYFTLQARCDRPYGFLSSQTTGAITATTGSTTVNIASAHNSLGDIELYPTITIVNSNNVAGAFTLRNRSAASGGGTILSEIGFTNIKANETITISGNLFTITSSGAGSSQSDIYARWDKKMFLLYPGNNYFQIVKLSGAAYTVTITYDAPIFIKD
jgi:hypothetical protein